MGLLDNQWNIAKTLWNGFGNNPRNQETVDAVKGMFGLLPLGAGDVASGLLAVDDLRRGDYTSSLLNGVGLLPFVPSVAGMFVGKNSKVWDVVKADEAQKLLAQGVDPKEVWKRTGTFKGADGNFRQEISDEGLDATKRNVSTNKNEPYKFNDVMTHPEYEKAYPLPDVYFSPKGTNPSADDWYGKYISIPTNAEFYNTPWNVNRARDASHEMQHIAQMQEGWHSGANQDNKNVKELAQKLGISPSDVYWRSMGEVEARATQKRKTMNMAERLKLFPEDSYDVPLSEILFP